MNVPINGLRMLAVEAGLLIAFTPLSWLAFQYFPRVISRPRWRNALLARRWRAVLFVVVVALVGRAALLPWIGIPHPRVNDEYSYLLMGDTFAHLRLTNPTPASWPHFETFHVNLTPTYHSKYPVAQGLALGLGEVLFRQPWIGVYLSTALLCGAICWTLQAFVAPEWALVVALLATSRLALFSYWMNSYWGGSIAALGGALALGSVVRLFDPNCASNRRALAVVFALSLLILANSRPYEGLAFAVPLLAYFAFKALKGTLRREISLRFTVLPVLAIGIAGLLWMAYYNQRTTGDPFLFPQILNERTYSPLPLFLWQQAKPPVSFHDPVFKKFFDLTVSEYQYETVKSIAGVCGLEIRRLLTNWFFYVGVALSLPAPLGMFLAIREPRGRITVLVALSTMIAIALCTYSMLHYAAPATITVYVLAALGLSYLWQQGGAERSFAVAVCLTVLVTSLLRQNGSSLKMTFAYPDTRELIARQLSAQPGKQLVLVSYDLQHHYPGDELVHNDADFASQKILWARSKGGGKDEELCLSYGDRTFWSVTTDDMNFKLLPLELCNFTNRMTTEPPPTK